jgi:hypothetical protein
MYYTDYSIARINHSYRQAQFAQAAETDRLARRFGSGFSALYRLSREKLGDGLISMGKLLKSSTLSEQRPHPCR